MLTVILAVVFLAFLAPPVHGTNHNKVLEWWSRVSLGGWMLKSGR